MCLRTCAYVYVRREGRNHTSEQVFVAAWYARKVFHVYIMAISDSYGGIVRKRHPKRESVSERTSFREIELEREQAPERERV